MSNGNQVKAAVVLWNGGDAEELKKVVETLAPWFGGEATVVQNEEPEPDEQAADEAAPEEEEQEEAGEYAEPEEAEKRTRGRKATKAEIKEWVKLADKGMSITDIARAAGRGISTVSAWVKAAREGRVEL